MLHKSAVVIALLCISQFCDAQEAQPAAQQDSQRGICLFTGVPPIEHTYDTIKRLKYGKGSYGSVNDLLPKVVEDVKAAGADAVINYNGAQHFGFFPWRFVRPVVTGTAVKWSSTRHVDCTSAGGHYTTGTLDEAPTPPQK